MASPGPSPSTAHGMYNSVAPTVADGQATPLQTDVSGNLKVSLGGSGGGAVASNITQVAGTAALASVAADGALAVEIIDATTKLPLSFSTPTAVNTEGLKNTYHANVTALASVASATDIFTITGSATKTVRVLRVGISGIATVAASFAAQLIKRSTANTGGTSGAATAVPSDSSNSAATATVLSYTANPTVGSAVGTIRSAYIGLTGTSGLIGASDIEWDFSSVNDQALVLKGIAQVLAVNLNGVTVTGGAFNCWVEWTEETP